MSSSTSPRTGRWFSPRRLGITRKTQLVIGAALFTLLAVLFLPLQMIVFDSFLQLEQRNSERNIDRALNALADDLTNLANTTRDYASWDEAYAYVRGEMPEFTADNFNQETFETNRLNLVLITDLEGRVRYSRLYNGGSWRPQAEADTFVGYVLGSTLLDKVNDIDGNHGLLLLPDGPLLLAARSILTSEYTGPRAGTMIMGRLLSAEEIARVGESLRIDLQIHRLDQTPDTPQTDEAFSRLLNGAGQVVTPLNDDWVAGYSLLRDLAGRPVAAIQVTLPREIWANGTKTVTLLLVIFAGTGVAITLTITTLLNRLVLTRLARLIEEVQRIGEGRSLTRRLTLAGDDELSELAEKINQMLGTLEQSEAEGRQAIEERLQIWSDVVDARRQFISTVSHELRTPLTPIRGYIDMMLMGISGEPNGEQRSFLQAMRSSTDRMQALVDDLLDMSRMDAAEFSIQQEALEPAVTVEMALKMITPLSERREVSISAELDESLPQVWADKRRLEQILVNLLSNAVKYTHRGGRAWVSVAETADGICFSVGDNGVGMTPAQLEKLFTPFYRADNELRDEVTGTGLGLSITKRLVDLHGGQIQVESTVGVGSLFRVTLPVARAEALVTV